MSKQQQPARPPTRSSSSITSSGLAIATRGTPPRKAKTPRQSSPASTSRRPHSITKRAVTDALGRGSSRNSGRTASTIAAMSTAAAPAARSSVTTLASTKAAKPSTPVTQAPAAVSPPHAASSAVVSHPTTTAVSTVVTAPPATTAPIRPATTAPAKALKSEQVRQRATTEPVTPQLVAPAAPVAATSTPTVARPVATATTTMTAACPVAATATPVTATGTAARPAATAVTDAPKQRRTARRARHTNAQPQVMEPYDGLMSRVLREECARRLISVWSSQNKEQRHRNGYIQLLRIDDQRRAAAQASAQRHQQDLDALARGALHSADATTSPARRSPSASSFLSPNAALTPASTAAANAAVLYPPRSLLNDPAATAPPSSSPVSAQAPTVQTAARAIAKAPMPAASAPRSLAKATPSQPPTRLVRPRRGCYFRLVNVVLSSDFSSRWQREMFATETPDGADVNAFWLDVHVAFMSVNQLYGALQFHDPLFRTVDPGVILTHEAVRLCHMWREVVLLYQRAVARAAAAPASDDHSFFDHALKRLDVLYLHMALLCEPELAARIAAMDVSSPFQLPPRRAPAAMTAPLPAAAMLKSPKPKRRRASAATRSPSTLKLKANAPVASSPAVARTVSIKTPPASPTPVSDATSETLPVDSTAAATAEPEEQSYALVVSGELRDSAFETFAPHALPDDDYGSSDYDGELPPQTLAATRKRRRRSAAPSTDIVECTSTSLVPHTGAAAAANRMHSTAIVPRSDVHVPRDEWDILESRIRKVNESLDRCHRALAGGNGNSGDAPISDTYRMTLEHDLRFYSAIKQRLQEQLLMVMQGY